MKLESRAHDREHQVLLLGGEVLERRQRRRADLRRFS
jgi:hypothetical protein